MNTKQSIQTFTGRHIEPLNPSWEDIDIVDIAHGLSNICRYGGQCSSHYSVAQHSVYVSYNVKPKNMLNALLHDASEAYLGDVPSPIKRTDEYGFYRKVEAKLQNMIIEKYGNYCSGIMLDDGWETDDIKKADKSILTIEQANLFNQTKSKRMPAWMQYKGNKLTEMFYPWQFNLAYLTFIERFKELGGVL